MALHLKVIAPQSSVVYWALWWGYWKPEVKSSYTKLTRVWGETADNLFLGFIQETRTWDLGYLYEKTRRKDEERENEVKAEVQGKEQFLKRWLSCSRWYKTSGNHQDVPGQFQGKPRIIRLFHKVWPEHVEIEKELGDLASEGWPKESNCQGKELNLPEEVKATYWVPTSVYLLPSFLVNLANF